MPSTRKGTKKTSNSRKSRNSTRTGTAAVNRKPVQEDHFADGIILILMLILCILLLVSTFGNGGFIGQAVCSALFGLFGRLSYFFPILLFVGAAFLLSNRTNFLAYKKLAAALIFYVLLCGLVQLAGQGFELSYTLTDYYAQGADYHIGGGLTGGAVSMSVVQAFGLTGGMAVIITGLVVCLIIMTQRSLVDFLAGIMDVIFGAAEPEPGLEEERELKRKLRQQKRLNRQEARRQRRIEELEAALAKEESTDSITDVSPEDGFVYDPSGLDLKASVTAHDPAPALADPEKPAAAREKKRAKKKQDSAVLPAEDGLQSSGMDFEIHRMEVLDDTSVKPSEEETEDPAPLPASGADFKKEGARRKKKTEAAELEQSIQTIAQEIGEGREEPERIYQFPPLELLARGNPRAAGQSNEELRETAQMLHDILHDFGVNVTVTDVSCGPTVTRYELSPEPGVKVSRIVNLADDIKLNLAAEDIRIEAPIPGKAAVGIEVPNKERVPVMLRDLLSSSEFQKSKSKITFAVGKDIAGKPVMADIAKMPHLLIAGATGSGKSVCINALIVSILYKAKPEDVQLIMIDPKVVELSVYNGIPHLLIPVVTDPKKASGALNWAVTEMTNRYNTFAEYGVRNINEFNRKTAQMKETENSKPPKRMSQIVIIVDELADLMMVAPGEVEDAICRLAQLARAAGIHMVIATQRPSVNVITGLIKANMPSRIAFAVSSGVDSRTILDSYGAEKLLGNGDMLFSPQGYPKPARLQGAFVSDDEISSIVSFLSSTNPEKADNQEVLAQMASAVSPSPAAGEEDRDVYFAEAGKFIIEKERASIGMLQRLLKIGFNRAARIMDQLSDAGVVGPEEGTKPRKILMSMEQFENYLEENG